MNAQDTRDPSINQEIHGKTSRRVGIDVFCDMRCDFNPRCRTETDFCSNTDKSAAQRITGSRGGSGCPVKPHPAATSDPPFKFQYVVHLHCGPSSGPSVFMHPGSHPLSPPRNKTACPSNGHAAVNHCGCAPFAQSGATAREEGQASYVNPSLVACCWWGRGAW